MATPVYAGDNALGAGNGTDAAIPVPASVASGDILVVTLHIESDLTITPPSGFAQKYLDEQNDGGGGFRHYTFWKRATGADAGTYTFTWDGTSVWREGLASRITGAKSSGDPFGA